MLNNKIIFNKKRRSTNLLFLVENYLEQFLLSCDFEALELLDFASFEHSAFLADLADLEALFILEFLPNIVFTSRLFKV